jgi:hypothetical protein
VLNFGLWAGQLELLTSKRTALLLALDVGSRPH